MRGRPSIFVPAIGLVLAVAAAAQDRLPPPEYRALIEEAARVRGSEVEALVVRATRLQTDFAGLDEFRARMAVHRDLAEANAGRGAWADAINHLTIALRTAETVRDAAALRELHVRSAGYFERLGDVPNGLESLDRADLILAAIPDPEADLRSALLRASLLSRDVRRIGDMEGIYARLLGQPGADRLRIERERARRTRVDRPSLHAGRWSQVLELARAAGDRETEAEAHDRLGSAAEAAADFARAARHFAAAEQLGVPLARPATVWLAVVRAYVAGAERDLARRAIAQARALVDPEEDPARAATLHEATAELLAQEGNAAAAYPELRRAVELRRRRTERPEALPLARLAAGPSPQAERHAVELEAIRHALRDAELDRSRLRAAQTAGIAAGAVLVAAVLGLAYAYKRRAAAALAAARDNAELRAERTHWQMLRYQLNPHFLFNALSSLGGLVASQPAAAGRVVDRLSEFCQLALKGANEDVRPLERELEIIRAYLDVEQAGAGDSLRVMIDAAPDTLPCLLPPLLLQPLVENALKYGGLTSEDRLEVAIAARRRNESGELVLEVANTGRWVEPGSAPRVREAVGLANIRERLARFAGPAADLTFVHDGNWVRARLRLPARTGPPGNLAA